MRRALAIIAVFSGYGCFNRAVDTVPAELLTEIRAATTPEEIREWLATKGATALSETNRVRVERDAWPNWVHALTNRNAQTAFLLEQTNGTVSAFIIFHRSRSAFHGIDFHSSTNGEPRSSKIVRSEMWVPGIYAWHARED